MVLYVDWSAIPEKLVYYKHFVLNIYYVPRNDSVTGYDEEGNEQYLVDTLDNADSKRPYLYLMGEWFRKRDDEVEHKRQFALNLYFNRGDIDVFIRVEMIHGTYRTMIDEFLN